ncbi:C40 family peptidase [Salimicrobium flavidum]|uniref:Permuted papain-like amidase enzyme, YaeF/YiiX, C92 family n=1 Tax=Salimicrobium flavidum TaxID=570947 RepID=A0A1N7KQT7_9BACI|nr:hypothetical protein [Salimicrobium flavidum]SIS63924.1 hypothetical protein SAMN05421687_1166 [Salimicrobium flavidum]
MKIYFSRNTSVLSRLIQKFTAGRWSHNAIWIDEYHIIDSRFPKGVQIRHFDLKEYEILEIEGNEKEALKHIEKRYDLWMFFWYIFKYGKRWNNPNQMICSELIAECAKDENLRGKTPSEQYRYLKRRG